MNGHVYPEVDRLKTEAGYKQRKVVYRNLRNGRFADVSEQLGPPVTIPKAARGAVFADFDNDGDVDVLVNNVHDTPDLFRLMEQIRARTLRDSMSASSTTQTLATVQNRLSSGEALLEYWKSGDDVAARQAECGGDGSIRWRRTTAR